MIAMFVFYRRGVKKWVPDQEFYDQYKGPFLYVDEYTSKWKHTEENRKQFIGYFIWLCRPIYYLICYILTIARNSKYCVFTAQQCYL